LVIYLLRRQCDEIARTCGTFKRNKKSASSRLEQGNADDVADPKPNYAGAAPKRSTRAGEAIGLGVEYAVLDSWTLKAEYLYLNYSSFDTFIPSLPITVHNQFVDNVARQGLNHRFPAYWKY
jgi:opacity protein-like surface antigen